MVGISKKENSADDSTCSANSSPYCIGRSYWNAFHGLRDGKKTEDDKNHGDDAGDNLGKTLAEFQSNGKADFKETS